MRKTSIKKITIPTAPPANIPPMKRSRPSPVSVFKRLIPHRYVRYVIMAPTGPMIAGPVQSSGWRMIQPAENPRSAGPQMKISVTNFIFQFLLSVFPMPSAAMYTAVPSVTIVAPGGVSM